MAVAAVIAIASILVLVFNPVQTQTMAPPTTVPTADVTIAESSDRVVMTDALPGGSSNGATGAGAGATRAGGGKRSGPANMATGL